MALDVRSMDMEILATATAPVDDGGVAAEPLPAVGGRLGHDGRLAAARVTVQHERRRRRLVLDVSLQGLQIKQQH